MIATRFRNGASWGYSWGAFWGDAGGGFLAALIALPYGLAMASLMGLPPSGGFAAKWLLLQASVESGQWAWAVIMLVGGLLAGGYVYRVIAPALARASVTVKAPASRRREAVALALALGAVLLGFVPLEFLDLLQIGRPVAMAALP